MKTPQRASGDDGGSGEGRRLVVAASHSELRRVSEWVRAFATERQLTRQVAHGLELAVDEALTNIMSYAFRDNAGHEIAVELRAQPDRISVELEDDGVPFNPLAAPVGAPPENLEKSRPSGRGILLMTSFMDDVQYERRDGKNVLTMVLVTEEKRG